MAALNKTKRNFTVSLFTSIGMVSLLLYYILVYLPRNQQRLEARNFRVLSRIGDNLHHSIQASVTGLHKMAQDSANQEKSALNKIFLNNLYRSTISEYIRKDEIKLKVQGSVHLYRNIHEDVTFTAGQSANLRPDQRVSTNSYELHFKTGGYHYAKNLNQVLGPLLRDDVFQEFYVFKDPGGDFEAKALKADQLIYSTSLININFYKSANPDNSQTKGAAGNVLDIDLAGQAYKLFVIRQEVGYGQQWVLCGAMPASAYNSRRMAIPNDAIGLVALGLVLLVLAMPFIKLALLGEKERLHLSDIGLCFLSLFLGAAILILLWLNGQAYWGQDKIIRANQLQRLAETVEKGFKSEVAYALNQITELDSTIRDANSLVYFKIATDSATWQARYNKVNLAGHSRIPIRHYPFFTRLTWVDSAGNQLETYAKNGQPSPLINVKDRPYFRKIVDQTGWRMQSYPDAFYLNPLKSWLDGQNYVIISRRSANTGQFKKAACITMTTKLVSLTQAILPPHFGFLIINEVGEVLFHANNKLDLNENFVQETGNSYYVRSALQNKLAYHFSEYYQGGKKNIYVKPITDLPLYVVAFVDKDYIKFRYLNNFVLANSLFIFYFVSLIALLGLLLLAAIQPTKIAFYQVSLTWLRPQQRFHQAYQKLILFLGLAIILILSSLINQAADSILFMLLLAPFYFLILAIYKLNNLSIARLKVNARARRALRFLAGIILLLNGAALIAEIYLHPSITTGLVAYLPVGAFQVALAAGWLLINKAFPGPDNFRPGASRSLYSFEKYYFILVLLLVCLTSTLPAVIFYKDAYNREAELMLQYHQLYLDNALQEKETTLPTDPGSAPLADFCASKTRIYASFFHNTTHLSGAEPAPPKKAKVFTYPHQAQPQPPLQPLPPRFLAASPQAASLLSGFNRGLGLFIYPNGLGLELARNTDNGAIIKYFFNAICPPLHQVLSHTDSEDYWLYQTQPAAQKRFSLRGDKIYLQAGPNHLAVNPENRAATASLPPNHFVSEIPYFSLLPRFWLNTLLFLGFLYFLIKYLIRRIFNIKFTANLKLKKVDEGLLEDFAFHKIVLVALPGTFDDNQTRFRKLIPDFDAYTMVYLNLAREGNFKNQLPYLAADAKVMVWVKHFNHQIYDKAALIQKINLLGLLKKGNYAKIILQTSEHPAMWEEKWKKNELPAAVQEEMPQLLAIMSEYWKVFLPLQVTEPCTYPLETGNNTPQTEPEFQKMTLQHLVLSECSSCPFLHPLQPLLHKYIAENCEVKMLEPSDIILKIQSLAQLYYRMLWWSCTKEEQYLMYDMAQDGLMNARNLGVLTSLLSKGLLIKDENQLVRLFNQSFQQFILTVVSPAEALQFEKEKHAQSRWETYKIPLLIVLIGVAAFIFLTQQETWVTVLALLTGVSTLLNLLPRFSFLLPALFLKKEAK